MSLHLTIILVVIATLGYSLSLHLGENIISDQLNVVEPTTGKLNVWPLPTSFTTGTSILCLSNNFNISIPHDTPEDLTRAVERTRKRLHDNTHRYLSVRRGEEFFQFKGCDSYSNSLQLLFTEQDDDKRNDMETRERKRKSIMDQVNYPLEDRLELEGYNLTVSMDGKAELVALGALGLFRGLSTFEQLFYYLPGSHPSSIITQIPLERIHYAPFAPYHISDKPAFPWRSVLLDTSRHFIPLHFILKTLDTMALVKVVIGHITDSNSWPLQLSSFPELSKPWEPEVYTEEEVKEVIRYGGERGIDVILEIDTPGHTASIGTSHPEKVACLESAPWNKYANEPPTGQLRFALSEVAEWTAGLFEKIISLTRGRYFGTGGDEINIACMLGDPPTVARLQEMGWTLDDALDEFVNITHGAVREAGATPVVWQEMVLDHGDLTSLKNDTIVAVWIQASDAQRVVEKGYRVILASADYFYLAIDCGQGSWIAQQGGGNSWCDPFKSWQRIYSFDPSVWVTPDKFDQVLGEGQTSLWTEQTDETNFESTLWPRAAALVEVFWTGGPYPLDSKVAMERMNDIRYRLVSLGISASPVQPHWCALRPGSCDA
ncbi:hypothetical protein TREMEDRAFT_34372 [Tremella mesenterica DSM 1558]|uniref:uncharacterized protein n=1 Tax=Tremella mesenterica (strain ATCC 24925 / CBS 8224 / DSM 1558 / NBRC 9311 / NRRL Y-6157 / RJB 2259-6 / UBC 559-6) TaxID=578456 RepID=UPI0003F49FA2|nr:uncharacterized protein TREMEDRAFT_34372 [Tremella mesenterica DSM 1558]EIW67123.1 hypothetical protein TREMEDRAFT_34372 [Tremella mesenterica DSM 1558]